METRESYRTSVLPELSSREAESMRPGLVEARQAWADVVRAAWQATNVSMSMARHLGRVDAVPAETTAQEPPRHWRLRPRLTVRSSQSRGEVSLPHRVLGPLG